MTKAQVPTMVDAKPLNLVQMIVDWKAMRRSVQYREELAVQLVSEETIEGVVARDVVSIMDSIGDMVFSAISQLWTFGLSEEHINALNSALRSTASEIDTERLEEILTQAIQAARGVRVLPEGVILAKHTILMAVTAYIDLRGLGDFPEEVELSDILEIIILSNYTKTSLEIPDGHKYSSEGKGARYVSPQRSLEALVSSGMVRREYHKGLGSYIPTGFLVGFESDLTSVKTDSKGYKHVNPIS